MNDPSANGAGAPVDEMNRLGRRVQELMEEIESLPDTPGRALTYECITSLVGFYGLGLERILQIVKRSGIGGQKACEDLIHDRIVSGMLLIHGLHPASLETRLTEALEKIRPYMQSDGGNVELLSLEEDFARLRLEGACKTCPSSGVTLDLAVRHAIEEACPDLIGYEVEGAVESAVPATRAASEWKPVEHARYLQEGGLARAVVSDVPLVLCKAGGQLYTYRDRCPACNLPLHLGALADGILSCRAGHRFSVRNAGVSPDDSHLFLDLLPLVAGEETVEVSLPAERNGNGSSAH
jgi:Fe-S cluster biogenesis protein NfuA/nitrite reductase/ring-hydroxylating ferredoxin subunit